MNGGSANGGRRAGRYRPMAEINVTPFVDVMLVLLVVFMITAPLLSIGVSVDLPKTKASSLQGNEKPLTVTVDKDGAIFLMEQPIKLEQLAPRLKAIAENRVENRIYVRGDRTVNYGAVMRVMGALSSAGFKRVALITEMPRESK